MHIEEEAYNRARFLPFFSRVREILSNLKVLHNEILQILPLLAVAGKVSLLKKLVFMVYFQAEMALELFRPFWH